MKRAFRALIVSATLVSAVMQLAENRSTAQGPALTQGTVVAASGAKVDPLIAQTFNLRGANTPITVVVTYQSMPSSSELSRLQSVGITKGITLTELPMVIAPMNAAQLAAVRTQPRVRSIYANRLMKTFTNTSRRCIGVQQMMADRDVQRGNHQNPG